MRSTIADYTEANPENGETLKAQWGEACDRSTIHCASCELLRAVTLAFRCLYCGLWFCADCAEAHFGQTIADYRASKVIEHHDSPARAGR